MFRNDIQILVFCFMVFVFTGAITDQPVKQKLIFSDEFSCNELSDNWIIEKSGNEKDVCRIQNGVLELNSNEGVTVWYKEKLSGDILIEFDRRIIMAGGIHDRLSDLNQFWMATDPMNKMFTRKGNFPEYDSLQMYYAGMGGNYNTTTRMRRYDGKGKKMILGELTDSAHLLKPDKNYHIVITCKNGKTGFNVNGEVFFSFDDDDPFTSGWFAFRSTKSHQVIDNLKIWQLE